MSFRIKTSVNIAKFSLHDLTVGIKRTPSGNFRLAVPMGPIYKIEKRPVFVKKDAIGNYSVYKDDRQIIIDGKPFKLSYEKHITNWSVSKGLVLWKFNSNRRVGIVYLEGDCISVLRVNRDYRQQGFGETLMSIMLKESESCLDKLTVSGVMGHSDSSPVIAMLLQRFGFIPEINVEEYFSGSDDSVIWDSVKIGKVEKGGGLYEGKPYYQFLKGLERFKVFLINGQQTVEAYQRLLETPEGRNWIMEEMLVGRAYIGGKYVLGPKKLAWLEEYVKLLPPNPWG